MSKISNFLDWIIKYTQMDPYKCIKHVYLAIQSLSLKYLAEIFTKNTGKSRF